jgi:hypothetical protein
MGGPANIGYSGGKFDPKEKDLIRGIVAAKSLQALVAICISPEGVILNVLNIRKIENNKKPKKRRASFLVKGQNFNFIF